MKGGGDYYRYRAISMAKKHGHRKISRHRFMKKISAIPAGDPRSVLLYYHAGANSPETEECIARQLKGNSNIV
jgi:hypothetical protein